MIFFLPNSIRALLLYSPNHANLASCAIQYLPWHTNFFLAVSDSACNECPKAHRIFQKMGNDRSIYRRTCHHLVDRGVEVGTKKKEGGEYNTSSDHVRWLCLEQRVRKKKSCEEDHPDPPNSKNCIFQLVPWAFLSSYSSSFPGLWWMIPYQFHKS